MSGADQSILAARRVSISELVAGLACLVASISFLMLARGLPPSPSTGDVGPGALPVQIGVFGIICALIYLLGVIRGQFPAQAGRFVGFGRALSVIAIFSALMIAVKWIGLAAALAIAGAATTLLFRGENRLMCAASTGVGVWLIAYLIFQKFLDLPLP